MSVIHLDCFDKFKSSEKKIGVELNPTQKAVHSETYSVEDAVNKVDFGKFQIRLTLLAGFGWLADAFEIFILSIIGDFMACDWPIRRWQIALLTSLVFAGIAVGSLVLGTIADIYGRKKALAFSVVFVFIFGCVSAVSPSFTMMVILRTCLGFSLGGIAQAVTLCSEYCPAHMRGKSVFYMCYFWSFGSCGVVLLAWVIMEYLNKWRILLAATAVPSLIVILSLKWYPESARYYVVSKQFDHATNILQKMASMNGKDLPPGRLAQVSVEKKRGRFRDLLSKEYRKTSLLIWLIWFATAFAYYGMALLSPILIQRGSLIRTDDNNTHLSFTDDMMQIVPCASFTQRDYINLLWTSAAEFPGLLIFTFLIERISRKMLLSTSCIISSILSVLLLLNTHKIIILLILFCARAILVAVFQLNYLMTSEAYPTTVRAIGMGTGTAFCRLGGLIVPYVAQVLVIESPVIAMCLLGGLIFMAGIAAACLPFETRGAQMKESLSSLN